MPVEVHLRTVLCAELYITHVDLHPYDYERFTLHRALSEKGMECLNISAQKDTQKQWVGDSYDLSFLESQTEKWRTVMNMLNPAENAKGLRSVPFVCL